MFFTPARLLLLTSFCLSNLANGRPKADTSEGSTWDFSSVGSWNGGPLKHASWPIKNGRMQLTAEKRKEISIRNPHTIIPAEQQNVVQITMTAVHAKICRLYFTTGPDPVYDDAKMIEFALKDDDVLQTYNLDMTRMPTWTNEISSMKFSFPNATPDMKISVARIKVLVGDKISVPLVYTTYKPGVISVAKEFRLGSLFNNGMVLQRQMKIPVWGHARAGATVTVEFDGKTVSAMAEADGDWKVRLDPLEAGGPYLMKVSDGSASISLSDILVGDVWICSGQSNMGGRPRESPIPEDQRRDLLETAYPNLRSVNVPTLDSVTPTSNNNVVVSYGWKPTGADPVMSAVSYYFGRELHATQHIPIGLIFIYKAGTQIEEWMSEPALRSIYSAQEYDAICGNNKLAAGLYNGMVSPTMPYGIKGTMWYQGESNATSKELYMGYYKALPAFIKNWRDAWGEGDFPFMVVQLPRFAKGPPEAWPNVREAQLLTSERDPRVGLAVTFDTGDPDLLHPKNKYVVGHRLALAARQIVYGEKITGTGPMYQSMKVVGQKIVVTFSQTGTGMVAREPLSGFEIRDNNGHWSAASATVSGANTLEVTSPSVAEPKGVRYAWTTSPDATLFNKEGLPASPFTSDIPKLK